MTTRDQKSETSRALRRRISGPSSAHFGPVILDGPLHRPSSLLYRRAGLGVNLDVVASGLVEGEVGGGGGGHR